MAGTTAKQQNTGPYPVPLIVNLVIIQIFGLIMLFSASYTTGYLYHNDSYFYISDQLMYTLAGEAVMIFVSRIDYHWLRRWTKWGYAACLVLLCVVLTCDPINGCRRWLHWKGIPLPSIQVSEIVKFEMILMTAYLMCRYRPKRKTLRYGVAYPLLPLAPIILLMYFEPHFSGMILICAIVGTIMLLGGSGGVWIVSFGGLGVAGLFLLYRVAPGLVAYVGERLDGWTTDITKMPYQTVQSLYAIGSGGWFGLGLGNSMEKQLWLPECTNDFIFSVVCEELGFVGAMFVIFLFGALILQCIHVAFHAADLYGTLIALGIMGQIAWQVFCNIAVVTNTMPNTGISLPFFSSGGTSLLMLLGEVGVLLNIARQGKRADAERQAKAAEEAAAPNAPAAEIGRRGPSAGLHAVKEKV
ncbi:MAG: putative lipid II flippase FtsW [Faecalibacterium sp.]|jgi:cell division protein FtsW|nr:putative lipid II flippase FtsW [Faecalibacterium sp.]